MIPKLARLRFPNPRQFQRWLIVVFSFIIIAQLCPSDYRPTDIDTVTARYQFTVIGWELRNLPDKWLRRAISIPQRLFNPPTAAERMAAVEEYFAAGERIRRIGYYIIALQAQTPATAELRQAEATFAQEQAQLRERQFQLRAGVEETLESAVADTLKGLGFQAWTGVFPPVDTALTGSPTVLIVSPRDQISRQEQAVLRTDLTDEEREWIESRVESDSELSALVVDTGGVAFYPSITRPDVGLDYALEIIAHEWVHQWLWFRPLGRAYFEDSDITTLNETVATIAGQEIGELTHHRMQGTPPPTPPVQDETPDEAEADADAPAAEPEQFDFQREMRDTRVRVDELLAAGEVDAAEAYMDERRRAFVEHGYYIRRLNQAYFAFHGTYATTGAAGVSVIGEQVKELRRRSPSLTQFIRTAAGIGDAGQLASYLDATAP